jgi:dienelactone hydrolase
MRRCADFFAAIEDCMSKVFITCLLLLMCTSCAHPSLPGKLHDDPDMVLFPSSATRLFGPPIVLNGRLKKPAGDRPFPAIVLLHGCGGVQPKRDHLWAERLAGWGYVTLQVDSFGPRGIASVCTLGGREAAEILAKRVDDAYDAQHYLAGLPFVDRSRIAVMGWSHGAVTTLHGLYPKRDDAFHVAVAIYPSCRQSLAELNAPLLILIGEKDDWTPAERCVAMMPAAGKSNFEVSLQVYPDAYHAFDSPGRPRTVSGSKGSSHHLEYNQAAEQDAIIRVREFLGKYLQP